MTGESEAVNVLELFAGIGGLSLGLQRAGMTIVGHVEINPFSRAVLHRHWPEVPCHDDVHTARDWWHSCARPRVDVVAGGYPCQPESTAGRRLGDRDARWLWPRMADIIADLRPRYVVGENVLGHRTKGLGTVLADLDRLGYTARAGVVRACEMGAPHARGRVFVLAHADGVGRAPGWCQPGWTAAQTPEWPGRAVAAGQAWWSAEPGVDRVAYGVPARVDRVTALGNAVSPFVAEHIGRTLLERW